MTSYAQLCTDYEVDGGDDDEDYEDEEPNTPSESEREEQERIYRLIKESDHYAKRW